MIIRREILNLYHFKYLNILLRIQNLFDEYKDSTIIQEILCSFCVKKLPQFKMKRILYLFMKIYLQLFINQLKKCQLKLNQRLKMFNDIGIKIIGDLTEQKQRNILLQQRGFSEKRIKQIISLIALNFISYFDTITYHLKKQQQLEQYQHQFDQIQEQIKLNKNLDGISNINKRSKRFNIIQFNEYLQIKESF